MTAKGPRPNLVLTHLKTDGRYRLYRLGFGVLLGSWLGSALGLGMAVWLFVRFKVMVRVRANA